MSYSLSGRRVFVAGHNGLVGSAIVKKLREKYSDTDLIVRNRSQLELTSREQVLHFFQTERPEVVIDAAARVGGILDNNDARTDFLSENIMIQTNLMLAAHATNTEKFLFLGSSCIYPKDAPQPMLERYLLTGPLEYTNRPYAIAKIAGLELINALNEQHGRRYLSLMPTNLYGPGDNFHSTKSHVIPGLIRRFHEAKIAQAETVTVWGTGKAKREFLFVEDLASAVLHLCSTVDASFFERVAATKEKLYHINVGSGHEVTISSLATTIAKVVGYRGRIIFDPTKPDGAPRKLLDFSLAKQFGWQAETSLKNGLENTYNWFCKNTEQLNVRLGTAI